MADYKMAKDVIQGDKLVTKNDQIVRITSVHNGIFEGCVCLNWSDGFAEVPRRDKVMVAP